ncbi:MAG TPA: 6,7-dimethyl-8-ribityllumazine synthase [Vicinamibacterales bacterium]|jgi:6,7-dimethyl-8-ribityllumazine synthase|nr:6,7-dimethyl-8-ribityllumazine synthase [Vicinamibacterales bacterium]
MELQGSRHAAGCRFAVVVSSFNAEVTAGLLQGALDTLAQAEVSSDDITIVRVPGAFEIPLAAMRLAETGRFDAIVAIGCLIKGDTMHFEYIASTCSQGIMQASTATGVPIAFGVLTTLTEEQAAARSGSGPENKGREAALAAIEMATLFRAVGEGLPE